MLTVGGDDKNMFCDKKWCIRRAFYPISVVKGMSVKNGHMDGCLCRSRSRTAPCSGSYRDEVSE